MSSPDDRVDDQDREPSGGAKGRLIGVSVALVVAVGIVLVTGLAWPGWFSSDSEQKPSNAAATGGPTGGAPSSAGPTSDSATPSGPAKPSLKPAGPPDGAKPKPAPGGGDQAGDQAGNQAGNQPNDPRIGAARAATQAYADAINTQDVPKMVSMVCDLTKVEKATYIRYFKKQFNGGKAKVTLYGPTKTQGEWAQTRAKTVARKNGERGAHAITITMQNKGEKWCIPSRG